MPDITMCANDDCPLSEGCYRNPFSGTNPNPLRQSWSRFTADEDGECDHFLAVQSRPQSPADGSETTKHDWDRDEPGSSLSPTKDPTHEQ